MSETTSTVRRGATGARDKRGPWFLMLLALVMLLASGAGRAQAEEVLIDTPPEEEKPLDPPPEDPLPEEARPEEARPEDPCEIDPWACLEYEPIPAGPHLFSEGAPQDESWDVMQAEWDGVYNDWTVTDSDWELLQTDWAASISPEEPDPYLNCDQLYFPRAGCTAIMQNDHHGDVARTIELRALCKVFFRRTVLQSRGQIHSWYLDGTLYGVEFDWFSPSTGGPPPDGILPVVGQIFDEDEQGLPLMICNVYCYTRAQFAARRAVIEARIHHPMDEFTVWLDNTISTTTDGKGGLEINGGVGVVYGPSVSLSKVKVAGGYHVLDDVSFVDALELKGGYTQVDTSTQVGAITAPKPVLDLWLARLFGRYVGSYYRKNVKFDRRHPPKHPLVFAEGDIEVNCKGLEGEYTFISARGRIKFRGRNVKLRGWMSQILALAYGGKIVVASSNSEFMGEMMAPRGEVKITGAGTTLHGIVVGEKVNIRSGSVQISDGTHPHEPENGN